MHRGIGSVKTAQSYMPTVICTDTSLIQLLYNASSYYMFGRYSVCVQVPLKNRNLIGLLWMGLLIQEKLCGRASHITVCRYPEGQLWCMPVPLQHQFYEVVSRQESFLGRNCSSSQRLTLCQQPTCGRLKGHINRASNGMLVYLFKHVGPRATVMHSAHSLVHVYTIMHKL